MLIRGNLSCLQKWCAKSPTGGIRGPSRHSGGRLSPFIPPSRITCMGFPVVLSVASVWISSALSPVRPAVAAQTRIAPQPNSREGAVSIERCRPVSRASDGPIETRRSRELVVGVLCFLRTRQQRRRLLDFICARPLAAAGTAVTGVKTAGASRRGNGGARGGVRGGLRRCGRHRGQVLLECQRIEPVQHSIAEDVQIRRAWGMRGRKRARTAIRQGIHQHRLVQGVDHAVTVDVPGLAGFRHAEPNCRVSV